MCVEDTDAEVELYEHIVHVLEIRDAEALAELIEDCSPMDLGRAVSRLTESQRGAIIDLVRPDSAADLLEQLPAIHAPLLLEPAQPDQAAAVIHELPSDMQADVLSRLGDEVGRAIVERMQPVEVAAAQQLQQYPALSAGGLMIIEFLTYPMQWTVGQVNQDLKDHAVEYRDYEIQYAYVCNEQLELKGVLRLRDLLLSDDTVCIEEIMLVPLSVQADESLPALHDFFQDHHFLGVPVVDAGGKLVGVLQRLDVDQAWIEQQDKSFLRRQGIVSGEEIRALPLFQRLKGRLVWLSLNIVLNLMAAAIISHYESTLAAAIALTAFLPIISDMSGCSGNQAVAVSIRELMLGIVQPRDVGRVWLKEVSVGLFNGIAVGVILGTIAWIWKGNLVLGMVVGFALALNTVVAVSLGGIIPLVLRALGKDPAVASGPLLTTITDMCGFFVLLSLASYLLPYLR